MFSIKENIMLKQSNATSLLLDQLIKTAQNSKPKNTTQSFADQVMDTLKKKEPTLQDICKSAFNQAKANKIAQLLDALPERPPTDEFGPPEESGIEGPSEVPIDEAPIDDTSIENDPMDIINQITDLLDKLKSTMQTDITNGVEDLGDAENQPVPEENTLSPGLDVEEPGLGL